jgi:hypothetical protein
MTGAGEKKPPAITQAPKKQDPLVVTGVTTAMQRVNMNPPPCFSMKTEFPYLLSPTSYFLDGTKQICLDFLTIPMYKDKYKIELGDKGTTIKVSMKIPPRFVGYQRLITELDQSKVVQDCNTIVSVQRETSSLVCAHYGDGNQIWSPPFVIPLPFSCENGFKTKQLWVDGCNDLYAHMSALANVGQCPAIMCIS